MGKLIDLTGQRFGQLTVLERAENGNHKQPRWKCRCDCGKETIVFGHLLRNGNTKSCGCFSRELHGTLMKRSNLRHGDCSGAETRLYRIWGGMKNRCYNSHQINYKHYGGRGIAVCEEWLHDFTAFRDWAMSHGYRDDLTIDRIDNDKGYSPDNCRWVTMSEQRKNQRPRKGGAR